VEALGRPSTGVACEDGPQERRKEHDDDHPSEHVFATLGEHVFDVKEGRGQLAGVASTGSPS
jgi:hypothetical protein